MVITGHDETVLLDVHELVVGLLVRLEVVVAQAEIQREPRGDFPVIVDIICLPPVPEVSGSVRRIDAGGFHVAEHEIGQRAAGVRAIEAEAAARRPGLLEGDVALGDIGAEFQEVLSVLPGERIDELVDLVGAVARADLALQVVSGECAVRSVELMVGGPYSSGSRETSGRPIFPTMS